MDATNPIDPTGTINPIYPTGTIDLNDLTDLTVTTLQRYI